VPGASTAPGTSPSATGRRHSRDRRVLARPWVGGSEGPASVPLVVAGVFGIANAVALWWLYFDVSTLIAEHSLGRTHGRNRVQVTTNAYGYGHLPIVSGIVLAAVGREGVVVHAKAPGTSVCSRPRCCVAAPRSIWRVWSASAGWSSADGARSGWRPSFCSLQPFRWRPPSRRWQPWWASWQSWRSSLLSRPGGTPTYGTSFVAEAWRYCEHRKQVTLSWGVRIC
jgi:hypothetical protein